MNSRLGALAILALTVSMLTLPASAAVAADECTPSITMDKPFQDVGGTIVFPASYRTCGAAKVTVKFRDRDVVPVSWGGGSSTMAVATVGSTNTGLCNPDGLVHRWVAYATIKTPTGGTLIAEATKVYFKSAARTRNCAPYLG